MARNAQASAGLLLYRTSPRLEVFLAHPGGPFWQTRDAGVWTIPKGMIDSGEAPLDAARREFQEETGVAPVGPFLELGSIRQKGGKVVHAWAWKGDADPGQVTSNMATMEWPRGSGRTLSFPEVDRCAWFDLQVARERINSAQGELLDRLEALVTAG